MGESPDVRAWLRSIRALVAAGADRQGVIVTTARIVGDRLGRPFPERGLRLRARSLPIVPPPPPGVGPDGLGRAYESTLDVDHRQRAGAHYTPPDVARRLADIALDGLIAEPTVCDPSCGGGAFLLGAAQALAGRGLDPIQIAERLLWGVDLDPLAVAVTEAAVYLWSGISPGDHLAVADGLTAGFDAWPTSPDGGFTAVIGNPPFQSQLGRATARSPDVAEGLRARFGPAVAAAYADSAWIFLAAAIDLARDGGRVVLIQPQSLLAARDAAGVRRRALERATLEGLWVASEPVFDAAVRVCAPVLRVGGRPHRTIRMWHGTDLHEQERAPFDPNAPSWAPLAAGAMGVPKVTIASDATVGDLAHATAGFRDEYYGLIEHLLDRRDADEQRFPRVVTSGLIEPGRVAWGERPVRLARARRDAPRLDVAALRRLGDQRVARWVDARLVPKVIVATQSRVVEAAVDRAGTWVPCTPVISVEAPEEGLNHLAAVLLAPPVTAWALREAAGTALAPGAVKLAARQVLRIPLPRHRPAWDEAAALIDEVPSADDRSRLVAAAERMCAAYGIERTADDVMEWWSARLPPEPA